MKTESLKKNYMYNSIAQVLSIAFPFITAPYVSRILGAENLGVFSYTYSIAGYFILFAMLGLKNYGNRSCAYVRDDKKALSVMFWNIYAVQLFGCVIIIVLYLLFSNFQSQHQTMFYICVIYVLSAMFDISWFVSALEQFKRMALLGVILKFVNLISVFSFVKNKDDLWIYSLIAVLGVFFNNVIYWFFIRKKVDFVVPTFIEMKKHIVPNLVLFIPVIAVQLYKTMDKIMLGALSTMEEVGYYSNAEKVVNIPMYLITSLGAVTLPRMSNLVAKKDGDELERLINKSMLFVLFLSFAMTFGMIGIAKSFVPLYFGMGYEKCIVLMQMLAITIVFVCWANVIRTQFLLPRKRDKEYIISVFWGAIVNLMINYLLIPTHGSIGVMIGTIVAEILVCVIQSWSVRKQLPLFKYFKYALAFCIIGVCMLMILLFIGELQCAVFFKVILQIVIGTIIYLLFATIYLRKTQKNFFNALMISFYQKLKIKNN